jgi:hypothetical protein
VGRKKPGSTPQDEDGVAAMFRRVGEKQIREAASWAKQAEWIVRTALGDEAGSLLKALPPEDRARAAYELFQRIKDGRMKFDDAILWLEMRMDRTLHRWEQAAKAGAAVKAERSRGGEASTAARRAPWKPWQEWLAPHQYRGWPKFQGGIVSVIRSRALGKADEELERRLNIPAGMPAIPGKNGKPPSERSIRRRLFGAK